MRSGLLHLTKILIEKFQVKEISSIDTTVHGIFYWPGRFCKSRRLTYRSNVSVRETTTSDSS